MIVLHHEVLVFLTLSKFELNFTDCNSTFQMEFNQQQCFKAKSLRHNR